MHGASGGVLLSVRPRFSRGLLDGSKEVELRRQSLRVGPGAIIALYEAAPTKAMAGFVLVKAVHEASPEEVWRRLGRRTLVSRDEYTAYFDGCKRAFAIEVGDALRIAEPVSLGSLRRRCPGFMPPRSFRYLATLPASLLMVVMEALKIALGRREQRLDTRSAPTGGWPVR